MSVLNATAIQPMTSDISSLGSRDAPLLPESSSHAPKASRRLRVYTATGLVSFQSLN